MSTPFPIVVLASGRGSTFAALLEAQRSGRLPVVIRAVLSDRRSAPVMDIAESGGIATLALRPRDFADRISFDHALLDRAAAFNPALIVLAGYMRIIAAPVVAEWRGRMINLHPSLLPRHPGLDTYARTLACGDSVYGASVHYVTDELDGGPVISQAELPVLPGDTPELLSARLRPVERELLIETIRMIASGRLALGRLGVELDGETLATPLKLRPDGGFAGL